MKLYTEQDVLKMLRSLLCLESNVQLCMLKLTPIELPSDEEIEKNCHYFPKYDDSEFWAKVGFLEGAQWMRDKILQNESNT